MWLITFIRRWLLQPASVAPNAAVLPPPRIDALLDDIDGGQPNLLPFSATLAPLRIDFEPWQNSHPTPEDPEALTLFWDGEEIGSKDWTAPIEDTDLFISVPERYLSGEGAHTLGYRVVFYNGNSADSTPLTISIDRTPPQLPDDNGWRFPDEVMTGGVTDTFLQAHGDTLNADIPPYFNIEPGDVLTWYWSATVGGPERAGTWILKEADTGRALTISVSGDFIRASGDGVRYARYTVQDRAGTAVQRALPMPVLVNATPVAPNFPAPYLKETGSTAGASTLDPSRALNGGTLVIKPEATFEPDDEITVFWAVPGEYGAYSTATPLSSGSREYAIPKLNIAARLASRLEMYYEVTRRGNTLGSTRHNLTVEAPKNLPNPQCDKVTGNYLSLGKVGNGKATFTLTSWQHRNTSQFIRLYIEGRRKDGKKDPVMVAEAAPVSSITGTMTVGSLNRQDLEVFEVPTALEIRAFLSVDNLISWIEFPHSSATLVD